jgi:insulin-like growth factor 2 mRNA-binding protein 1
MKCSDVSVMPLQVFFTVSEQPQSMMFPGLHPMAMMSTSNMGYTSRGSASFPGGMYGAGPAPFHPMYQSSISTAQSGGQQSGDTQVCTFQ